AEPLDGRMRRAHAVRAAVETGKEYELQHVPAVHTGCLLGRDEAALEGGFPHRLGIDARAVVADLDRDPTAVVPCAQHETAFGRLPRGDAHVGRLDTVVDGAAHEVR